MSTALGKTRLCTIRKPKSMKESVLILKSFLTESKNISSDFFQDKSRVDSILALLLVFPQEKQELLYFFNKNFKDLRFTENTINSLATGFLDELAEKFSLNPSLQLVEPEWLNNKYFAEKLEYYQTLQLVIRDKERQNLKAGFDKMYERLVFEIPDETLEESIKLHSRKELKKKFQLWDEDENEEQNRPLRPAANFRKGNEQHAKEYRISWWKISVAASVLLVGGFIVFQLNKSPDLNNTPTIAKENKETKDSIVKDPLEIPIEEIEQKPEILLAEIEINKSKMEVWESLQLGYAGSSSKLNIDIQQTYLQKRIESLEKAYLETNEQKYLSESEILKNKSGKYFFNGKSLNLYDAKWNSDELKILKSDEKYYLFVETEESFYELKISDKEQAFLKENKPDTLEILEKIIFENE